MKKIISLTVMVVFVLITLTGCVTVNYELTINKDGSGEISYIYAFDKSMLESLGITAEDMVYDMQEQAEESGYKVESYADDNVEGFKATKKVEDVTKDYSLEEAFGDDYVKDTDENKIKIEKGMFSTTYSQKAEIDLSELEDMSMYGMTITYTINLPAKADKHNADEETNGGKTLTWNLEAGKVTAIEYEATQSNSVMFIIIGVIGLVVVLGVVMLVVKAPKKETAASDKKVENVKPEVEPEIEAKTEEPEAVEPEDVKEDKE